MSEIIPEVTFDEDGNVRIGKVLYYRVQEPNAGAHPQPPRTSELTEIALEWYKAERARRESTVSESVTTREFIESYGQERLARERLYKFFEGQQ